VESVADGLRNKEIARVVGWSIEAITVHLKSIVQKIGARDRATRVDDRGVRATLLTDIEEMQRVTEALQASEQRLRETLDGIPAFVYTMAPNGQPEFFNRPFLDYFGKTPQEMMDWARIGVIHPDDLARSMAVWRRAVETGQDYSLEFRLRRADGVFRWFELRSRTVRDAGGQIVRSYGVLADMDDRKRAERRLRRAMRARYDAALAERMRIARDMHDGLLQDITGLALQLGAALPHVRTAPDAAADRLTRILHEAQRVNRAARDAVLGMRARTGAGHVAGDLVRAVHAEAQRVTALSGLALSVRVSGLARLVPSAVRDAAVSIVQEALTNVLKHAGARGVRVSIAFRSTRLRVSVRDDGGGMNPAGDPHHATTQFGLVGMRERATSIGAELCISTAVGRGTSVRLNVPCPMKSRRRLRSDGAASE
jgi:PAS domain S-box-containing protein